MDTRPVEITVVGRGQVACPAERCRVSLMVTTDGRSAETAAEPAHRIVHELTGLIEPLHNAATGPIDSWSVDQVRHDRYRPVNVDGEQLPYVYRASASIIVEFGQIDVIDAFVYAASAVDGLDIADFEWTLTDESVADKTRQVRTMAVQDAVDKAEVYARSVGRTAVTALAIADPGFLGTNDPQPAFVTASRAFSETDGGFDLRPQDIVLRAEVHAKFSAS